MSVDNHYTFIRQLKSAGKSGTIGYVRYGRRPELPHRRNNHAFNV